MSKETQKKLIEHVITLTENKLNWGQSKNWKYSQFESLSELVFEETNIKLSGRTLRRLFIENTGDNFVEPHIDTKNALAVFHNYRDWYHLTSETLQPHSNSEKEEKINPTKSPYNKLVISLGAIMVLGLLMLLIFYTKDSKYKHYNYIYKSDNTEGIVPFTVKFDYDFTEVNANTIELTNGVISKPELIKEKKGSYFYTYKFPTQTKTYVKIDGKIVDSIYISALSGAWKSSITNSKNYYPVNSTIQNSIISIPKSELSLLQAEVSEKEFWSRQTFGDNFPVDLNNCKVTIKMKLDSSNAEYTCPDMHIMMQDYKAKKVSISLANKGCNQKIAHVFSEKEKLGTEEDMSSFTTNLRDWFKLSYIVIDQKFDVLLNDKTIYSDQYENKLDSLRHINITGRGYSMIDYVLIQSNQNDTLFFDHFD